MELFTFPGYRKLYLTARIWQASRVNSILLIVHGFGEHSGRFDSFAEFMNTQQVSVMSFDLRGHGDSPGKRGRIMQWIEFREDLSAALEQAWRRFPGLPLFLFGHSLGGAIVTEFLLQKDMRLLPKGVILSSPLMGVPGLSSFKLLVAQFASRIIPDLTMKVVFDKYGLSRIPEEVDKYSNDPLVHSRANVRFSTELMFAQEHIFAHAGEFPLPLLMVLGTGDTVVSSLEPMRKFFEMVKKEDKHLEEFEDGAHELHNDIVREEVLRLYANWIRLRS